MFEELARRGVERIEFVVGGGLAATEAALRDAYPSAIVLPSGMEKVASIPGASAQALFPSFAMSAGRSRRLVASHEAAQNLQRLVRRAIGRHGPFSGPTDATAFALDRLHRAEQRTKVSFVPNSVANEALTGPATRRRNGVRSEAPRL